MISLWFHKDMTKDERIQRRICRLDIEIKAVSVFLAMSVLSLIAMIVASIRW